MTSLFYLSTWDSAASSISFSCLPLLDLLRTDSSTSFKLLIASWFVGTPVIVYCCLPFINLGCTIGSLFWIWAPSLISRDTSLLLRKPLPCLTKAGLLTWLTPLTSETFRAEKVGAFMAIIACTSESGFTPPWPAKVLFCAGGWSYFFQTYCCNRLLSSPAGPFVLGSKPVLTLGC